MTTAVWSCRHGNGDPIAGIIIDPLCVWSGWMTKRSIPHRITGTFRAAAGVTAGKLRQRISRRSQHERRAGTLAEDLPAVRVLEAYGPKRFAAKLRNVGLPLYDYRWRGAQSFADSGGAGAQRRMAAAAARSSRHGKRRNYGYGRTITLSEGVVPRRAAWIVDGLWRMKRSRCRITRFAAHLLPIGVKPAPVASSRDAWAIELTRAISSASGQANPGGACGWGNLVLPARCR